MSPIYLNISDPDAGRIVTDIYDNEKSVRQGESIETYEDLSGDANYSETNPLPVNEKSIAAENGWTSWVRVKKGTRQLSVSISGLTAGDATVTLQGRKEGGTEVDVTTFTADARGIINEAEDTAEYRIGVKTGEYTSGTIIVRLGKEGI
jgi:hypothetical protein